MAGNRTAESRISTVVCMFAAIAAGIAWIGWTATRMGDNLKLGQRLIDPSHYPPPRVKKVVPTRVEARFSSGDMSSTVKVPGKSVAHLAEEKTQKLRVLILELRGYQHLCEEVYAENPQLREVPELLQWLATMPAKQFAKERAELAKMEESSPERKQQLHSLMWMNMPAVVLAMLDDPKFGSWMNDIFEVAGLKNKIVLELQIADYGAGYKGTDATGASVSIEALKASLLRRVPAYEAAAEKKAAEAGIALTGRQQEAMFAAVQKDIMIEYLKLYYDSFFGGDLAAKAAQLTEQEAQYYSFARDTPVAPEVWAEYKAVRESLRISPMTEIQQSNTKAKLTP